MSLEDKVRHILFQIGKEIEIHRLIDGHMIVDINYEKYVNQILDAVKDSK